MNWSIAQLVLGARDLDNDGWMQLVVFLILGVFWAVGGIMKSRAEKERQKKQQGDSERPAKAPQRSAVRSMIRGLKPRQVTGPTVQQRPLIRPRPTSKEQQRVIKQAQVPKKPTVVAKKTDRWAEQLAIQALSFKHEAAKPKETRTPVGLSEFEVSLDSVEQLRSAIVHYEIFGKCVSSREPYEQMWM